MASSSRRSPAYDSDYPYSSEQSVKSHFSADGDEDFSGDPYYDYSEPPLSSYDYAAPYYSYYSYPSYTSPYPAYSSYPSYSYYAPKTPPSPRRKEKPPAQSILRQPNIDGLDRLRSIVDHELSRCDDDERSLQARRSNLNEADRILRGYGASPAPPAVAKTTKIIAQSTKITWPMVAMLSLFVFFLLLVFKPFCSSCQVWDGRFFSPWRNYVYSKWSAGCPSGSCMRPN